MAIGALLRTVNALENIRNGEDLLRAAVAQPFAARRSLKLAIADLIDGVEVLTKGPMDIFPRAAELLREALALARSARATTRVRRREELVLAAIDRGQRARERMLQ